MGLYADKTILEQKQELQFIQAINEVYFGRTASINRVFNAFCDWRDKYKNKRYLGKGDITAMTNKEYIAFVNEVKREWNYYSVTIMITQSDTRNAFSVIPVFGVGPKDVEITRSGYRYKDGTKVSAIFIMNVGLAFDEGFTNEECFAIFLHEVGHNFQNSTNNILIGLNWASELIYIQRLVMAFIHKNYDQIPFHMISIFTASNKFNTMISKGFNSIVLDNKVLTELVSFISFIASLAKTLYTQGKLALNFFVFPLELIVSGLMSIPGLILNPLGTYVGYMGERFADGFPASYGFAISKSTALYKLNSNYIGLIGDIINNIPIVGHIYNAMLLPGIILTNFGDEHPETSARAYSILNDLKSDLKDPNLDPALKKQLEQEIKEYEKNIDEYFEHAKNIKNPQICKVLWDEFIYYKANGGIKYKALDPNSKFRIVTNATADNIKQDKYNIIAKTKIK